MQESLLFGPGFRSGNLVVLCTEVRRSRSRNSYCLVRCLCGKEYEATHYDIKKRRAKNCKECGYKNRNGANIGPVKHGMSYSSEYRSWRSLLARCINKKTPGFHSYGGRGIKVCERWKNFENFFKDMGIKPFKGAQLDRINPDGNYEPSNCRWVSAKENANNRRSSSKNRDRYIMIDKNKLCETCTNTLNV